MEGGTLKEYVEKHGPIEPRKLFDWLIGPVKALGLAHRRNIIHRDIKPSNLMFDEHDHLKLMDFGLADVAGEEVSERLRGKAVGSLGWIAPETANGRDTTAQSDLYSLGLVMYYALTGKSLIRGKTRSKVIAAHRTPPTPDFSSFKKFNPKYRAILERCLAIDPKDRYQSADALLVDLEDCANFDPVERRRQRKATLLIVAISAVTSAMGQELSTLPVDPPAIDLQAAVCETLEREALFNGIPNEPRLASWQIYGAAAAFAMAVGVGWMVLPSLMSSGPNPNNEGDFNNYVAVAPANSPSNTGNKSNLGGSSTGGSTVHSGEWTGDAADHANTINEPYDVMP